MLSIKDLKKYYSGQKAVDGVSFEVREGTIFGLLGPNGAGKSSLLRMITGITIPDSGSIHLCGELIDMRKHSAWIGYMPEERGLYKKMKVGEQAMYLAQLKGLGKADAERKIKYWFDKMEMMSWWNKKVEDLSKGMSQKLQFVTTVLHEPRLLIMDEPFSGLDPVNSDVIKREIYELASKGITVLFSTHRMEQVEEICKEIVLINKGKVILDGEIEEVRRRYREKVYKVVCSEALKVRGERVREVGVNTYEFSYEDESQIKDFLRDCLDQDIQLYEFKEVLPGLNEIFISLVGQDAVREFEK